MELDLNETRWKALYRVGALCALLAVVVMVSEIFLTALPDGSRATAGTSTIAGWFDLFQRNRFMAMRNLVLINIIASTLMIPVFLSMCGLHRRENGAFAGLTLMLFVAGYAVFMADNSAFPMLALSEKYAAAPSDSQKALLAAAGEALLARGSSHTPGTFPGFLLTEVANVSFCLVMLRGKVFGKATAVIGLVAFGFLFVFEVFSSFVARLYDVAMIFAMVGGVSAIVWYVMLGLRLLKVSR